MAAVMPRGMRRLLGDQMPGLRPGIGGPSRLSSYMRLLSASDFDEFYNNFLSYDTPLKAEAEREVNSAWEQMCNEAEPRYAGAGP